MFQNWLINKQLYACFSVRECLIRVLTFLPNFIKMKNVSNHELNASINDLPFK